MSTCTKNTVNDLLYFIKQKQKETRQLTCHFKFHEMDDEISLQVLSHANHCKMIIGKSVTIGHISDISLIDDFIKYLLDDKVIIQNYKVNHNGSNIVELNISSSDKLKSDSVIIIVESQTSSVVKHVFEKIKMSVSEFPSSRKSNIVNLIEYEEELNKKPENELDELIIKKLTLKQKREILRRMY